MNLSVLLSSFQTIMVSLEGLTKVVDPSQLTPDFEGSLDYDHEEWIEVRVAFEDFTSNAARILSRLEELQDLVVPAGAAVRSGRVSACYGGTCLPEEKGY